MHKKYLLFLVLILFPIVSAAEGDFLGTFKQGECVNLINYCPTCSYINLTSIKYGGGNIVVDLNEEMTKTGYNYNYSFCNTTELGEYSYTTCGDKGGLQPACEDIPFAITTTGGGGSMFFIILILGLATLFFIATLFVNEEFFVYISGVLFTIAGIYLMIYGLNTLSDWTTRALAYVSIGLGMLFTIGAYLYNSYNKYDSDEY